MILKMSTKIKEGPYRLDLIREIVTGLFLSTFLLPSSFFFPTFLPSFLLSSFLPLEFIVHQSLLFHFYRGFQVEGRNVVTGVSLSKNLLVFRKENLPTTDISYTPRRTYTKSGAKEKRMRPLVIFLSRLGSHSLSVLSTLRVTLRVK